jgi:hypothetical protein
MYLSTAETCLVIDFVNLNIKSTRTFKDGHRNKMYIHVYINKCSFILCL